MGLLVPQLAAPPTGNQLRTNHKRHMVVGEDTEDMNAPLWCEMCRVHTDTNHFDNRGVHKAGLAFGWIGRLLMLELAAERVVEWYESHPGRIPIIEYLVEVYDGTHNSNHGHRPRR